MILINKNIKVEVRIKSISLFIFNVDIKKSKDGEICFGLVKDSKNNKADPKEINSNIPLKIFTIKIPINWYLLF